MTARTGRARQAALAVGLAGTLAATAWVAGQEGPSAVEPARVARVDAGRSDAVASAEPAAETAAPGARPQPPARAAESASATELELARLQRAARPPAESPADAFSRHSWYTPPPPPKAPPPPRPVAPALPFKYMGRLTEGGKDIVFLTNAQNRNYAVVAGDTIERNYRVDAISEQALTLTYLPLGQQQTLPLPR